MITLGGCAGAPAASPTEAPSASASIEASPSPTATPATVKDLKHTAISADRYAMDAAKAKWKDDLCVLHLQGRLAGGPEKEDCTTQMHQLGVYAAELADKFEGQKPWPAEVEELADRTVRDLRGAAARADGDDAQWFDTQLLRVGVSLDKGGQVTT